jgi:hypothetical protein
MKKITVERWIITLKAGFGIINSKFILGGKILER